MVKLSELKKLEAITGIIIFVKYSLWCYFFILQGRTIELAIGKNKLPEELVYTLGGFIAVKIIVMLCDIFQKFMVEYYKNIELQYQWNCHIPKNIYRDNQSKKNDVNVLFFDYLPRLFEVKIASWQNKLTIFSVFTLTIMAFVRTQFFLGFFAVLLVFVLNYLSKNIFVRKIDDYQKESYHSKLTILNWVEQYFASYRELSKNWQSTNYKAWKNDIYRRYYISKKNQITFYLYRDLLAQVLVELPFLLNTSVVILGVYFEYLTLTQLFVWVGFSQFMINASNAYLDNKIIKKQIATLLEAADCVIENFHPPLIKTLIDNKANDLISSEVVMQDGNVNRISLEPGLYHIKGGNGSGKSTLMHIILGFERKDYDFKSGNFSRLVNMIDQSKVRVIDREAVIFDCFPKFANQICGPEALDSMWLEPVSLSLNELLTVDLAKAWMKLFKDLELEYSGRNDKILSSGERVILSLMRFFSSWHREVNLLIIDECDSFLDSEKKNLFINTVKELARFMAVYISCHDRQLSDCLKHHLMAPA